MKSLEESKILMPSGEMTLGEATQLMRSQVYPVILSYGSADFPLHGVGTAFLLGHKGHLFAISAQHILESQHAALEDFKLLIKDTATPMMFDGAAIFQEDLDPQFDLLIRHVSPTQYDFIKESGAIWLDTSASINESWFPAVDLFYVFGYPADGREYDYEHQSMCSFIDAWICKYAEPEVPGLATLKITAGRETSYRGLSGSIVIADLDGLWRFAGMVTLASEPSKLFNFIPASTITHYLNTLTEKLNSKN